MKSCSVFYSWILNFFPFSIVLIFFLLAAQAYAGEHHAHATPAPYSPYPQTVQQPNGKSITFQAQGNLYYVCFKTVDGYTLLQQKNGSRFSYYYAVLDNRGDLVTSDMLASDPQFRDKNEARFLAGIKKNLLYSKKQEDAFINTYARFHPPAPENKTRATKAWQYPHTGSPNLLVILAQFSDYSHKVSRVSLDSLFNCMNYTLNGFIHGGFQDYFAAASYGTFSPKVTVLDWVTVKSHDTYGRYGWPFQLDAINAALTAYPSQNWSVFDNDNDGFIEAIMILHAGPSDQSESGNHIVSIAYKHDIYNTKLGNKILACAGTTGEIEYPSKFGLDAKAMSLGLIVHEFGHCMGLSDLYPYDGSRTVIGYLDIMDAGCWNGWGKEPSVHCALHKIQFGWATPTILSTKQYVTMPNSLENKNAIYRINSSVKGEYFLLENKQPIGFDKALSSNNDGKFHGMIAYHMDSTMYAAHDIFAYTSGASKTTVNDANTNGHAAYRVLAANNAQIAAFDPDNGVPWPGTGSKPSFTDATTPNMKSWSGANTEKPITNIIEKNQVIEFSFMGAPVGISDKNSPDRLNAIRLSSSGKKITIKNKAPGFIGGEIKIYSCNGAIAYECTIDKSNIQLSTGGFPSGMYMISVSNRDKSETRCTRLSIMR